MPRDAEAEPELRGEPELCGRLVAWLAASLAGTAGRGSALAAIESGSDGQVVAGWPSHPIGPDADSRRIPELGTALAEVPMADIFADLHTVGVHTVALVLPVAGDPMGVTAGGAFAPAALDAQAAVVLAARHASFGLVPEPDLRGSSYRGWRWRVFVEPPDNAVADFSPVGQLPEVEPVRVIEQADRALTRALRDATLELDALDLAQWRPEVLAGRKVAEAALGGPGQQMPPGWPSAARALAERAFMLWKIVRVARADDGAASASGAQARSQALAALSHAVREAAMVAHNVPALSMALDDRNPSSARTFAHERRPLT